MSGAICTSCGKCRSGRTSFPAEKGCKGLQKQPQTKAAAGGSVRAELYIPVLLFIIAAEEALHILGYLSLPYVVYIVAAAQLDHLSSCEA